jgi:hypothetical protein
MNGRVGRTRTDPITSLIVQETVTKIVPYWYVGGKEGGRGGMAMEGYLKIGQNIRNFKEERG